MAALLAAPLAMKYPAPARPPASGVFVGERGPEIIPHRHPGVECVKTVTVRPVRLYTKDGHPYFGRHETVTYEYRPKAE
jgi:hypothetical protein